MKTIRFCFFHKFNLTDILNTVIREHTTMVFRCVVYGCGNIPKEKEISLHEFPPKSDRKRHIAWTKFVSRTRDKWSSTESCHVCSGHFLESDFENKLQFDMGFAKKLVLKKDAVPCVYPKFEDDPSSTVISSQAQDSGILRTCSQTDSRDDNRVQSAVRKREVKRKPHVRINMEQSGDSRQDSIMSRFSDSDDEVQDCSKHDVVNLKNEKEPKEEFQQINSGLEALSGTEESAFLKEESLHSSFEFEVTKEEQEERNYEVPVKIKNPDVRIKMEQPDLSAQDGIISKFSKSDDEIPDCTKHDVIGLKKEPKEEFQQINSELEVLSNHSNNDEEKKLSGYYISSQKSTFTKTQNCKFLESSSGDGFDRISSRNSFVRIKMEQCGESPQDGIIPKFSESDDEVQDCSTHDIFSLKKGPKEEFQNISSGLEILSGTGESTFLEEGLLRYSFDFMTAKEERSNEVPMKIQKTLIRKKTEQSGNSPQDDIISKFSESDDEVFDCTKHDVVSLKNEPEEEFQQINSELEGLSKTQNCKSLKSSSGDGFHEISSRGNNQKRQKSSHSGNKPYSCIMCSKEFGRNYHLKEHMRTHTGEKPYSCVVCGKQFLSNGNLKTHQRIHTGEKPYNCVNCGKQFASNSYLKAHQRIHTGEKPYSCVVCGRQFRSNSHLKTHQRIHTGEKPYSCVVCGKHFVRNGNVKVHQRIHTGEQSYRCVMCGKDFGSNSHLKEHVRTHTGEKPYSCVVCGKKFGRNVYLDLHLRTHTGEKPYSCLVCFKEFRSNSNLAEHKKVHTGEKPYSCVVCTKEFRSNRQLNEHMRTHTGEKPYSCVVCGGEFRSNSHLKRHQRLHTVEHS
ncbi:zinc finger and SCAN domain-containing protein 2-like isoform X1 [Limulus polyphemus]|uniref:Zinc finger and SCAN domain-containing protein 2-like isoform X1 n=1 Tax=Limulus polyphemus TaxID=6850 RepID=A0ABM1TBG8_LIMPO|nr:zinc finger and SCAN domain-containing protein 2-like isoform X1 [Limulus polyphemus]